MATDLQLAARMVTLGASAARATSLLRWSSTTAAMPDAALPGKDDLDRDSPPNADILGYKRS